MHKTSNGAHNYLLNQEEQKYLAICFMRYKLQGQLVWTDLENMR